MTDWDQQDAMGDFFGMKQRADIARRQAARDEEALEQRQELLKQNEELVDLLREQAEERAEEKAAKAAAKEAAKQKKLEAKKASEKRKAEQAEREKTLPRCPDCHSSVEVGTRRCRQCQAAIVSWDYGQQSGRPFEWRLICRASDAGAALQERCDALLQQCTRQRAACMASIDTVTRGWRPRVDNANQNYMQKLNACDPNELGRVRQVLEGSLYPSEDLPALKEMRDRVDREHPAAEIAEIQRRLNLRRQHAGNNAKGGSKPEWAFHQQAAAWPAPYSLMAVLAPLPLMPIGVVGFYLCFKHLPSFWLLAIGVAAALAWWIYTWRKHGEYISEAVACVKKWEAQAAADAALASSKASVAAMIAARDAAIKAVDVARKELQSAWQAKLTGMGLMAAQKLFCDAVSGAANASKDIELYVPAMRQSLLALASTREFAASLKVPLDTTKGNDRKAIDALDDSMSTVLASLHLLRNKRLPSEESEMASAFEAFERLRAALNGLSL